MPETSAPHLTVLTGASRGMGLAMAQQLAQAGHHVLCISRQANVVLASHQEVTQWLHDLSDAAPVAARLGDWLRQHDAEQWASVTLINNAGTLARLTLLQDAHAPDLANALRVGLEAPMLLTAAFLDATRDWPGRRRVLNISSGLGQRAMASSAAYCAAKAGLDHFTRCVVLEEARLSNGAKLCSLAPGVIDTDMQAQLRGADARSFADQASFERLHSQGQLTSAQDAAARVLAYLDRPDFGSQAVADVRN